MKKRIAVVAVVTVGLALAGHPGRAQSVVARSPNLTGGWTAPRGVIQFNLLHRFALSEAPLRKLSNTPTFNVGTGLTDRLMVGAVYGSNSDLVPAYPNEWAFYARALPVAQARGGPADLSMQAGYNVASESVDGAVLVGRSFGRVKLLAEGRAFSRAFDSTAARLAVAGGASVRLTSMLAVSGDYGVLLDRTEDERPAWGVGFQVGVPYTPHSLSVHASNVGTATLEGASRGTRTRWGFEYTIPITLRRYVRSGGGGGGDGRTTPMAAAVSPPRDPAPMGSPAGTMGDTVVLDIRNLKYQQEEIVVAPGTTVVWRNADPVQHSVVADDGTFDSGLIDPQGTFARTFTSEGVHPFHCMPHPFMMGRVVVRTPMEVPDAGGGTGPRDGEVTS